MDCEALTERIGLEPSRITMKSGDTVDITNRKPVTVSATAAAMPVRLEDGRYRYHVDPLVKTS